MYAAIAATRAEGRDHMRGIADKDHPVMDEPVDAAAVEGIDADPVEFEGTSADHLLDPWDHDLRLLLDFGVGLGAELQVDTIDIVRLLVEKRRLPGVERRGEPEPALGREIGLHLDIGDQEAFLEMPALEIEPELAADTACLLYTSPSPRDGLLSRMPSSA